jgi:molybdopterin molybdotransferase
MSLHPAGFPFPSPGEALEALLAEISPVGVERLALHDCPGRILAEEIRTDRPSPACNVSAMDGYALRLADAARGTLPIDADARIAREPVVLPPSAVARIVTGAPIPRGADTVIKREDVVEHPDRIEIPPATAAALRLGESIRTQSENAPAAHPVLAAGTPIGPVQSAVLASVGAAVPLVHRRVRVAILVTGDEVLPVDATPAPWELRDSNGPALACMIGSYPFAQAVTRGHAADELDLTTTSLHEISQSADLVFVTGGVSMGNRDHVPAALKELGARTLFHKLPQRPGKPVLAAILPSGTPVLALPGNPVSVLGTSRRLGVPVLRKLAGLAEPRDLPRQVTIDSPDSKTADLWWQRPARLTGPATASLVGTRGSGDIMNLAASDGFVEIPPGHHGPGPWPFYPWND